MAEISFTGNKLLKSIAREWSTKYPYLWIRFYRPDGKHQGDWSVSHATIRGKKGAEELSTNGTQHVHTFETRYEAAYGCKVEIMYQKNGRNYHSLGENNGQTLIEFNEWAKAKGASEIMKAQPDWF